MTDGGSEFTGRAFGRRCAKLGIRWHKLPPRSPNLNAFVERFQASVLHLHYRTAFRCRFYASDAEIDADLQAWLRYYNFERPTAATAPAAASPPRSSTRLDPTCSPRKDGTPMTSTQQPDLSELILGRKV
jgi:transposase InsO family protein